MRLGAPLITILFLMKDLSDEGMCACIKTFDPNIDEEMICRQISGGKYSMRVIKYKNTEEISIKTDFVVFATGAEENDELYEKLKKLNS